MEIIYEYCTVVKNNCTYYARLEQVSFKSPDDITPTP